MESAGIAQTGGRGVVDGNADSYKSSAMEAWKMHQEASCEGHPLPPEVLAVDTYVQQGGRWLLSLSSLTPAPAPDERQ